LMDKKWVLTKVEGFRDNGSLSTLGERQTNGSMETKTFALDGSVLSKAVLSSDSSNLTTELYWSGTTTLQKKTEQGPYGVTVSLYSEKGVITRQTSFGYGFNSMQITFFKNGVPQFKQYYTATDAAVKDVTDPKTTARKYRLTQVEDLQADGKSTAVMTQLQ